MAYKDIVPVGTGLIIAAASFGLGVVYAQWPYDLNTLWKHDETGAAFDLSLAHYTLWAQSPNYVHHVLHFVMGLGLIGSFIKLYKPKGDAKYFEYGSLGLLMVAIIIYLTNLRIGVNSCLTGQWGDVDMNTGVNVIAASEAMIVLVLVGVLTLQAGLYYAEWYDEKLREDFFKKEAEAAAAKEEEAKGESTGVDSKKKATKRK
ncbi:predicted protein [Scheffersomyces stipitis CBS 6054]|uniref:Secretory component protein SHR3 n=1 Tax=Scheffersomyces stipitis (strain ATCC 58785 / CBS 6054 / NBRC 10063 / NRRL Y-11545) TaxID=322104 RepID=A3LTL0_PICST|nr:predicted protein [Scheffersomyces stipitis CBS 6054]ABN66084.1 predicted protein [Scheffersomyces stipitis CBS 6054]KAG2732765.1 hypothetical protein G9P44_003755 [Scheffersomyces stipitis]